MLLNNSEEAKTYAVEVTSGKQSHDQAMRSLEYFKKLLGTADDESKPSLEQQILEIEAWLASDAYKNGEYPQGIDDLVLDLIEWRASIYALEHVDTKVQPFKDHVFFQQWLIGASYAMHCLLGKLVGNDPRENSLRNLWWKIVRFIAKDGACKKPELRFIQEQFTKHLTSDLSTGIRFRDTVIAHNEKSLKIGWSEIDTDIKVLVRIWSIIVSWSSFGIFAPFRTSEQAFSGLERFFDDYEMRELYRKRQEYIDMCIGWARTHLHNGKHDPGGYFIGKIVVKASAFRSP